MQKKLLILLRNNNPGSGISQEAYTCAANSEKPCKAHDCGIEIEVVSKSAADASNHLVAGVAIEFLYFCHKRIDLFGGFFRGRGAFVF